MATINPGGRMLPATNQQQGIAPPRTVNARPLNKMKPPGKMIQGRLNTKFTNSAGTPGNFGRLANKLAQSNGQ